MSGLMTLMFEIGVLLATAAALFFALGWWARGLKSETPMLPASEPAIEEPPAAPTPDLTEAVTALQQELQSLQTQNAALHTEIDTLRQAAAAPVFEAPPKAKRTRKKKT